MKKLCVIVICFLLCCPVSISYAANSVTSDSSEISYHGCSFMVPTDWTVYNSTVEDTMYLYPPNGDSYVMLTYDDGYSIFGEGTAEEIYARIQEPFVSIDQLYDIKDVWIAGERGLRFRVKGVLETGNVTVDVVMLKLPDGMFSSWLWLNHDNPTEDIETPYYKMLTSLTLETAQDDATSLPDTQSQDAVTAKEIDLSRMSYDELVALKSRIDIAIWNSQEWEEVTVPQGTWVVGEDIPAGHWTIKCADVDRNDFKLSQCCVRWGYPDENGNIQTLSRHGGGSESLYNPLSSKYKNGSITETDIELVEGMWVDVGTLYAPAVFMPYAGKPSLGFK